MSDNLKTPHSAMNKKNKSSAINKIELRIDSNNRYLTVPRSYGVYELPTTASGRTFRFGNHPIRQIELEREFGKVNIISLYLNREEAEKHARELNESE